MEYFIRAYKNYFNFQGRDTRKQFWMFQLFYFLIAIILGAIDSFLNTDGLLGLIFSLVSLAPALAIGARRLHDIDKSGWWQLIILIPIIGTLVLIYFWIKPSEDTSNRYGDNPLGQEW